MDHEDIEQKNEERRRVHRFRDYVCRIVRDLVNVLEELEEHGQTKYANKKMYK